MHGIAHLFLASLLLAAALGGGGPVLVLIWPASAVGLVGLAYLLGRPGWLGKGVTGRRSPAMTALLLPWTAAVGAVLSVTATKSREAAWHEIADGLFLGRMARFDEMPSGVDLVIDLTAELAADLRVIAGRTYRCVPALDVSALPAEVLNPLVEEITAWPGRVLIHCTQGRERSGLVMACVLVRRGLVADIDEAVKLIQSSRPGVQLSVVPQAAASPVDAELPEAV